jgi:signal transduction histidine kinase
MNFFRVYSLLGFFYLFPLTLLLGEPFYLMDSHSEVEITKQFLYSIVKVGKAPFSEIKNLTFEPVPQGKNSFGFEDKIYIFHTTLENISQKQKWILYLSLPTLDYIDLYIDAKNGEEPLYSESGDMLPFSRRYLPDRRINFEIDFKQNSTLDLYIRMKSSGSKQFITFLTTPEEFGNLRGLESMGLGFYYGGLFLISFYNLFIFIFLRDKTYLVYFLFLTTYLFLQSGVNGTVLQYLFPNYPKFTNILLLESYIAVLFTGMLFCEYYLKLENKTKKVSQLFQILVLIWMIGVFILPASAIIKGIAIFGLLMPAFWMYAGIKSVYKKQEGSIYYLIAWSILISGIVIFSLKSFAVLPANFFTEYAVQIGSLMEALLLSVGLAYRIDVLKKRSDYLNENLQSEVNLRTEELISEKEKSENSRIELYNQTEKLKKISEFTNTIQSSTNFLSVLEKLKAYFAEAFELKNLAIYLVNKEKQELTYNILFGEEISEEIQKDISQRNLPFSENRGLHINCYFRNKSIFLPNMKDRKIDSPAETANQILLKMKALYIAPLVFENEIFGIISLTSLSKPIFISPENRKFLDQLIYLISSSMYTFLQIEKVEVSRQKQEEAYKVLKASQEQLIQSEKMAALGNLVSGVAHEINTPIGAIKASSSNIQLSLNEFFQEGMDTLRSLEEPTIQMLKAFLETEVDASRTISTREERKIRKDLKSKIEAHGIEHAEEISEVLVQLKIDSLNEEFLPLWKNPKNKQILKLIFDLGGLKIKSKNIDTSVEKTSKIVYALKSYAKTDAPNSKGDANIIEGIETVLTIYQNYIKQGITVTREFSDIPQINCFEAELNQVWTNLIFNSIQAMKNKGNLRIQVKEENDSSGHFLVVAIEDSGSGIPVEIQPKIFDAFYTTKQSGEGSGLGLHICKQIIEKHKGTISVESEPGKTIFTVVLPVSILIDGGE